MVSAVRILSAVLLFLLGSLNVQSVQAEERGSVAPVPVLAIEYPPFTAAAMAENGLSFQLLATLLPAPRWQLQPIFLPPARAATEVMVTDGWLLSFFPPRQLPGHVRRLVLKNADIQFGLFRHRQEVPFRWQSLEDLAGHSVVTTRTLENSPVLTPFVKAGLHPVLVNSLDQGVQMIISGRADYLLAVRETGLYYAHQLGISEQQLQFGETVIQHFPHVVYLNMEHPLAQQVLQQLQ